MDLYRTLSGEALSLVREHQEALDRLPRTFLVNTLVELERWPTFFEPERAYFRTLVAQLAALDPAQYEEIFRGLIDFERRTGCNGLSAGDIDEFEVRALDHIRRQGEYSRWRQEIDRVFEKPEPLVEAQL